MHDFDDIHRPQDSDVMEYVSDYIGKEYETIDLYTELYMEVKLDKTYVIGTHVMWFEIEMYADFIDGMVNLLETVENKENVTIDLCLNMLEHFEKIDTDKIKRRYIK